jgi:hypothetical protein
MNIKNISITLTLLLTIVILASTSCRKEAGKESDGDPEKMRNAVASGGPVVYDGVISYSALGTREIDKNGITHQDVVYDGVGQFLTSAASQHTEDVGSVYFGVVNVVTDTPKYTTCIYNFSSTNRNHLSNATQFGSTTSFSLTGGSSFGPGTVSFYVPEEIFLDVVPTTCSVPFPQIQISTLPYRIFWNQDLANPNGVSVMVKYNGVMSNAINSAFSDIPFFNTPVNTTDIGYYDITAADLVGVPVGSIVDIYVGRGNEDDITTTNGKLINVEAHTHAKRSYSVIQ